MDIHINIDENKMQLSNTNLQKLVLIHNALNDGWSICKKKECYIFTKKHEGKKEVFLDSYLQQFIQTNMDINKLLST
jgi:hypothetical protein